MAYPQEDFMDIDASALIAETGEALGASDIYPLEGDGWLLLFDDESVVSAERDAERGVLVLATDLGHPPEGQELAAYRLLLQATAAWREMGGLRMGLDPLDDAVLQFLDLPLADLQHEALRDAFTHFIDAGRNARRVIAGLGAVAAPPADVPVNFSRA
jgi:hypothetical protein